MSKLKKNLATDFTGFGLDTAASFILFGGTPIPVSIFLKQLAEFAKPKKQQFELFTVYPSLNQLLSKGESQTVLMLAEKMIRDLYSSCIGDRNKILEARQLSEKRYDFLNTNSLNKNKIYLPFGDDYFIKDADINQSIQGSRIGVHSSEFMKKSFDCAKKIKNIRKSLNINVTSVCAGSIAVLLSMKKRYDIDLNINFNPVNAKKQMEMILFENDKEIDYLITAVPTFLYHSEDILGVKNMSSLKELHYELQFLMTKSRRTKFWRRNKYISMYTKSTAQEQFSLFKNKRDLKVIEVDDFELYPNLENDYVFAWEPLAFHLKNSGWITVPSATHKIIFSIFGNNERKDSLNNFFLELFCSEWLFCKSNEFYALELLLGKPDFINNFKGGCGIKL